MTTKETLIRDALRRLISVERDHLFGGTTGSPTARRNALEKELNTVVESLKSTLVSEPGAPTRRGGSR